MEHLPEFGFFRGGGGGGDGFEKLWCMMNIDVHCVYCTAKEIMNYLQKVVSVVTRKTVGSKYMAATRNSIKS